MPVQNTNGEIVNNFCENKFMNDILKKLLDKISEKFATEIFLSESDFKFNFAQTAKDLDAEDVIIEYPILTKDLYQNSPKDCIKDIKNNYNCKNPEERFLTDRTFIDLYFKHNNEEYFIEFKYKLRCPNCDVIRYGMPFKIKTQSVNNIARYQVYEDIERMENIKKNRDCHSYVVFITNEKGYWKTDTMQLIKSNKGYERSDCNFQLKDGKNTSSSKDGLIYLGGTKRNANQTEIYKKRPIYVSNSYKINWQSFRNISDDFGEFKILIIECRL